MVAWDSGEAHIPRSINKLLFEASFLRFAFQALGSISRRLYTKHGLDRLALHSHSKLIA